MGTLIFCKFFVFFLRKFARMSSNFYRTYIMLFLSALFFIALGIAIISYRYKIYEFTGDWSWAVQYL